MNNLPEIRCSTLILMTLLLTAFSAKAQNEVNLDSILNSWNFRIGPYFWFTGFSGEIIRPPVPSIMPVPPPKKEIDVGFKDVSNSIKFAAMLTGQFRTRQVVAQFNFTSLILESEAFAPEELILVDNKLKLSYFSGDFGAGYRILKDGKFDLDALVGLKFLYFKVGASTNLLDTIPITGERDYLWVDPVLGLNFKYRPHPRIELVSYYDIGPLVSDFTWQFMGGVNCNISKHFFASLGYRHLFLEAPKEKAIYIGHIKGLMLRLGVQF